MKNLIENSRFGSTIAAAANQYLINQNKMKARIITLLSFMLIFVSFTSAQDDTKYGDTPEQRVECMEALSVYRGFRDQDNLKDAYPAWQKALETCPSAASERMYTDGARFIKDLLETTESDERTQALRDSLMWVYDLRLENFASTASDPNNGCKIKAYKATDMLRHIPGSTEEAYQLLKEAIECLGPDANASIMSAYYIAIYELYKQAEGDEKQKYNRELLTEYITLQEIANQNIVNTDNPRVISAYEQAMGNLDNIFVAISDCENMVPVLQQKIAEEPDNQELKEKALRLMNQKDCTDSDFYLEIADAVFQQSPTAASAYGLGIGHVKKRDLSKGLEYIERAIELCGKCPQKETYLLKAAQIASALKRTSTAKNYANQVLQINPNSGEAYLVIGDAITGSSGNCDDGKLGARAVYWLATDYYQKAKQVAPSVASKANQKIASARSQYPSKQDIFIYSLKEGDTFQIECPWNESTTVRARP